MLPNSSRYESTDSGIYVSTPWCCSLWTYFDTIRGRILLNVYEKKLKIFRLNELLKIFITCEVRGKGMTKTLMNAKKLFVSLIEFYVSIWYAIIWKRICKRFIMNSYLSSTYSRMWQPRCGICVNRQKYICNCTWNGVVCVISKSIWH